MFRNVLIAGLFFLATPVSAETLLLTREEPLSLPALQEPPMLEQLVGDGTLPPVEERVPAIPLVVPETPNRVVGRSGGDLTMLVGRAKDSRLLSVYGYARLVVYDENYNIVPDILRQVEIVDGRSFTLFLRPGHKWSDGKPFTTEDFRYWWEDVANNSELSPGGPPIQMLVDGQPPLVEILDETTIRYTWERPNPFFLPALAGATPLYIYRPIHYLKKYHAKYADPAELEAKVKEAEKDSWAALHNKNDNLYNMDNPKLPTLEPWRVTSKPSAEQVLAERNPYFHRIDARGQQLPYLDRFIMAVVSPGLIATKAGAGESDLQSRGLNFSDYTFLKQGQKRRGFNVFLWDTVRGSELALYPNLNANDPVWRELLRDVRFRRALSLGINRHEINQVIYYGLGVEGNHSVLPGCPLYEPEMRDAWAQFDLAQANALLDEMGLTARDDDGMRLLPDGRSMEIVVESAGENSEEADVLELIRDSWGELGIKLHTKPSERTVLRNRIFAGDTIMAIWFGYENGLPTPDMSPEEFVPVRQQSYQWPKWGQHYETKGQSGEAIDLPEAQRLMELYDAWRYATTSVERAAIWKEILQIDAEQVWTIGLVAGVPQPIVASAKLMNIPAEAVYNWEPGAQFGVYQPASFWLAE